jgi:hypothetical protein
MRSSSASSSVENRGHSLETAQHAPQVRQKADASGGMSVVLMRGSVSAVAFARVCACRSLARLLRWSWQAAEPHLAIAVATLPADERALEPIGYHDKELPGRLGVR